MKRTLAFLLLAMLALVACGSPVAAPEPAQPAAQQSPVVTVYRAPT